MGQNAAISTLVFDFGGVIADLDMARCVARFRALGFEDIERYIGRYGQQDFFLQFEQGKIDTPQFRDEVRRHVGRPLSDGDIDGAWQAFITGIPQERVDLLLRLRPCYRLLLLSNTNPLHIEGTARGELARYGQTFGSLFDYCYLSYQLGMTKPQPEIFEHLLRQEGLRAEECLFLDDGEANIRQAERLGMRTHLVAPGEDLSFLL